jgi:Na+-driven multidrug efflux pump
MPAMGFGVAATALVGQALGAKDSELTRRYLKEIIRGSLLFTIASSAFLIFMPKAMMGMLTNQAEVIKTGAMYLLCMGFVQIPQNIAGVLNGALRGAGYTKIPMIVAALGIWGIRIPFSILFTKYLNFGVVSIWVIMSVDLLFRFLLSYALFRKKDIYSSDNILEKAAAGY